MGIRELRPFPQLGLSYYFDQAGPSPRLDQDHHFCILADTVPAVVLYLRILHSHHSLPSQARFRARSLDLLREALKVALADILLVPRAALVMVLFDIRQDLLVLDLATLLSDILLHQ